MLLRVVVVAAGVLAAGVASADVPTRMVNVHVSFKRTFSEQFVDTTKGGGCATTTRQSIEMHENVSMDSTAYPLRDDSNRVNFGWKMSRLPADAKPFEGSGEYSFHQEKHMKTCNASEDDAGSSSMKLDVDKTRFALEYERKGATGSVDLDPAWRDIAGSGTFTSQSGSGKPTTVDTTDFFNASAQATAAGMGVVALNTPAQWAQMGPYADATRKAQAQLAADDPVTIAPNGAGFEVHYTVKRTFDLAKMPPPPANIDRTGTRTVTTDVQITIGGPPLEYDAIIEPVKTGVGAAIGDYDTWIPIGPHPSASDGKANGLAFRVYLVRKDKPNVEVHGVPFGVRWQLETSHEPGWTINFPVGANADNDLEWDATMNHLSASASLTDSVAESKPDRGNDMIAIVRSRDFGAYGTLRAHVRLVAGGEIDAHMKTDPSPEVTIPKDTNHNHVADAWEKDDKHDAGWDQEHFDGNTNDGDGLSFYEEYRGAVIRTQHTRLDRKKKDVFIIRDTTRPIDAGAALFETAAKKTVKIWIIDPSEINTRTKEINQNSQTAKNGPQHAIDVVDVDSIDGDPLVKARCVPKSPPAKAPGLTARQAALDNAATSPGDVVELEVTTTATGALFDYAFAHELGHGLGIHHHGDRLPDKISYYGANPIIVDPQGKLIKAKTQPNELVGAAHSAASGDTACIMTYNDLFDYANVGSLREHRDLQKQLQDAKDARGDDLDAEILQQTPTIPDGKTLCTAKVGTNDRNVGKPYDAFGPAELGDCFGQLRVKDY